MTNIIAIVEGQTEQTFVNQLLAPHLNQKNIFLSATLPGHKKKQGGIGSWKSFHGDLIRTLKHRKGVYCTTMLDYYGMPPDWPGREEAANRPTHQRGEYVERAILNEITELMGTDHIRDRLIPYVQMHEFEALAFADIDVLAELTASLCPSSEDNLRSRFSDMLKKAGSAEAINDARDTCPSRRITQLVGRTYRKRLHSPMIASRIGLERLRQACRHFNDWVNKLERLQPNPPSPPG